MADIPAPGSSLVDIQNYIKDELTERGFDDEAPEQKLLLLVEEIGELARAIRKHAGIKMSAETTQTNLVEEFGDVLILTIDLCNKLGIDAEAAIRDKESKNKKRNWS